MKIEIWSDIACPFCYLGKRRLEKVLQEFPELNPEVIWRSYQLNPDIPKSSGMGVYEYLANVKGWAKDQAMQMNARISQMGSELGIRYDFDAVKMANTETAHRLIHLAKTMNKGNEAEEVFFEAYFCRGEDFGNDDTLRRLTAEIGLPEDQVNDVITTNRFSEEMQSEITEAGKFGITGVPFFVIDRKYGIPGAQPEDVFRETLTKASEN